MRAFVISINWREIITKKKKCEKKNENQICRIRLGKLPFPTLVNTAAAIKTYEKKITIFNINVNVSRKNAFQLRYKPFCVFIL